MIENETINKAYNYILEHIEEDIQVEDVANFCNYSKFYFNRLFKAETGESVYAFIKRVKMEQSAFRIKVERQKSLTDIGNEYGYSSSNFSTAFRQHHNMSPADFRKNICDSQAAPNPDWEKYMNQNDLSLIPLEECEKNISIEYLDDLFVVYERFKGNYHNLEKDWCLFTEKYKKYITPNALLVEMTYDDPTITNADDCMYDICVTVESDCELGNTKVLDGGKFAVYHFKGYIWQIYPVHQSFMGNWFAQSGLEIDRRYGFDIYRAMDLETMYMEIDICIPIK